MKKQRLKNYLKTGILLFGISLLFTNCEKELTDEAIALSESRFTVKILNKDQVTSNKQIVEKLQKLLPKSKNNSKSNYAREIYNSDYGFTINTDYVKLIDDGNNHSYNFPIVRDTITHQNVENLLLYSNEQGSYDAYIVTYDFTKEEYHNLNQTDEHTTTFTPIDFDTYVFDDNELARVKAPQLVCVETQIYVNNAQCECGCDCPAQWEWVTVSTECTWIGGGGGGSSSSDGTSNTGDGTSSGGGGSGSSSSDDGDDSLGASCRGCGDDGGLISAPAIEQNNEEEEECENIDFELNFNNNSTISNSPQFNLEFLLDNNPSPMASSQHYRNRIQATGQYFSNLSNNINNSTATTFAPIREMLADLGNNQELTHDDLIFIDTKVNEVYSILSNYNTQLETLDDLDNLNQILTPSELQTIEQNLLIAATLPTLKSMYLDFWPQNAEEWSEFGEFLLTVLQELVPELIPGVAEVIALKNAIENFNSGEYTAGAGELTLALVGIFPVGKVIKAIAKIAKGVKIVVRLSKSFRNIKKMTQAITSNSQEQALAFWKKIGCASSNNTRRVREINKTTEAQANTYFDLLTKNHTNLQEFTDVGGIPGNYRKIATMPDGSTIQIRNFSSNSPNTINTIDFSGGNFNPNEIKELKFNP